MKYYVGDIVYDVYSSAWHDKANAMIKITKVTEHFYYGYNIADKRKRAFMIKHSDVTVKLHKRGLSDILKRL